MTHIKYTRHNSKTGKDVSKTAKVLKIDQDTYGVTYFLEKDRAIFADRLRSELWGKGGYLAIVDNIELIK